MDQLAFDKVNSASTSGIRKKKHNDSNTRGNSHRPHLVLRLKRPDVRGPATAHSLCGLFDDDFLAA